MSWLARRDYSHQEITQKLKSKKFQESEIEIVIQELTQKGLINEQRFTENYIYSRRTKGYGPLRISAELQSRGIPVEMIAEQLEITDNAWFVQVQKVWQKQFKGKQPEDLKLRAKQIRFLQYRGFTREQIETVVREE